MVYNKFIKFQVVFFFITMMLFLPSFSYIHANDDDYLVPCGTERSPTKDADGKQLFDANGKPTGGDIVNPCTIDHLLVLINRVVNFIILDLAIPIAAICFAYAGFLLLFSGGESEAKTKAKGIFTGVAIGLIVIAASWLIINTILVYIIGYKWDWTTLNV